MISRSKHLPRFHTVPGSRLSVDLTANPAFLTIKSNIVGQGETTSFNDTTATNSGPYYYWVVVTWN